MGSGVCIREIKERNTLIHMLKARTMMWHPVLLLDQNITLYWNVLGVCCVLLQRYHCKKGALRLTLKDNNSINSIFCADIAFVTIGTKCRKCAARCDEEN